MRKQWKALEISVFCRDVAMMLAAGIAPEESVLLLKEENGTAAFAAAVAALDGRMNEGDSFAQAVECSGAFPPYACRMIAAGELAGRLEAVLSSLADYYERQDSLQQQLKSALLYPMILLLMMCGVLVLLVAVVLPVFENVYASMSGALAASSYRYILAASVISRVSLAVTAVIAAAVLICGGMSLSPKGKATLAVWAAKAPFTRNISRKMAVAELTEILSAFLASGLDGDSAMADAARTVRHPGVKKDADDICAGMQSGKPLAQALEEKKLFDALQSRMLLSAARSGQLEDTLARLAGQSEAEAEQSIRAAAELTEPVLTGFLTVAVGVSLLSIMLPLVGILSAMG